MTMQHLQDLFRMFYPLGRAEQGRLRGRGMNRFLILLGLIAFAHSLEAPLHAQQAAPGLSLIHI